MKPFFLTLMLLTTPVLAQFQDKAGVDRPACGEAARAVQRGHRPARVSASGENIDVRSYALDLTLPPGSSEIRGSVTFTALCGQDTVRSALLDLSGGMVVDSVSQEGRPLVFYRYPLTFESVFWRPFLRGELLRWTVHYHGTPPVTGFGSFVFSNNGSSPWIWSLSEPYGAPDWWPCKDDPMDKADSVDVRVTCASGLKVGSNGRLAGVRDNGNGTSTTHWTERYPIATYLVSITASNFASFSNWYRHSPTDSMEVLNYVLPQNLAAAQQALPITVPMLTTYSALFGEYPFLREKYGHCDIGLGGAMEHQTMTSTTTYDEGTVAHELGHQWFGDLLTCANWKELWLNEGFATYTEALWREARYGVAAYWTMLVPRMERAKSATGTLYLQDTTDVREMFSNNRVYSKGATVLHMLRHVLGDTTFFRALRSYVADPALRYGPVRTADFRSVCERVSGRDLGFFFDAWVFGENYPRYGITWATTTASGGTTATVRLTQETRTTNPAFFVMPVDLRLAGGTRDTTVTVLHTFSGQEFTFVLPFSPDTVQVDPGGWILKDLLPASGPLPDRYSLSQNYPNPFNAGTAVQFGVPTRSEIRVEVFDLLGRPVALLADGRYDPGRHAVTWDGRDRSGGRLASGVYCCRLSAEGISITNRMILLK